jgi:uncharacterized membrane protein
MFPIVLALHVTAALTAVVSGALSATARKGPGRHPRAGTVYVYALAVVFVSVTAMAALRWDRDWRLFIIAAVALGLAALGLAAFGLAAAGRWARPGRRTQAARDSRVRTLWHGVALAGSYVLLFTGFYVDNGPRLPLWDRLPHVAYWFIPAAVGAPLTWRALARYRARESTTGPNPAPLVQRSR